MDVTVGDLLRQSRENIEEVLGHFESEVSGDVLPNSSLALLLEDAVRDLEEIQIVLGEYKLEEALDWFVREDTG